jgi:hypothetical protein
MADADRWLNPNAGARLLAVLPEVLSEAERAFVERRVIAPWQRRQKKGEDRRAAAFALAATYGESSGRDLATAMLADMRCPQVAPKQRRPLIDHFLVLNGKIPSDRTLRRLLAGLLGQNQRLFGPQISATTTMEERTDDGIGEEPGEPGEKQRASCRRR